METKIRRLENNTFTLGTGVIAFSVWALLRYTVSFFLDFSYVEGLETAFRVAFLIIIVGFALSDVLLHLYIGVSARSEGKGKKKTPVYLVLTVIVIMVYLLAIGYELYLLYFTRNYFTILVTMLTDVTSVVIFIELFVYAVQLRRIRRQNTPKEATA